MKADDRGSPPAAGPPTAVVMGLTPTGLAVARALGRRGVRVVATHGGADPPAASSDSERAVRPFGFTKRDWRIYRDRCGYQAPL